jgi:hypothetical protein
LHWAQTREIAEEVSSGIKKSKGKETRGGKKEREIIKVSLQMV